MWTADSVTTPLPLQAVLLHVLLTRHLSLQSQSALSQRGEERGQKIIYIHAYNSLPPSLPLLPPSPPSVPPSLPSLHPSLQPEEGEVGLPKPAMQVQ